MPAALNALAGGGVHVLTFNDYLARRDAEWMRPDLPAARPVGRRSCSTAWRRRAPRAYRADVTYVTAKEAGFDHLRDLLARPARRPRSPAVPFRPGRRGGFAPDRRGARAAGHRRQRRAPGIVVRRGWRGSWPDSRAGVHYDRDEYGRDVELTEAGIEHAEQALGCGSLHDDDQPAAADRAQLRAARPRAAAPRRGLPRPRRPHRHHRRAHRPRRRRTGTGPTDCRRRSKPRKASRGGPMAGSSARSRCSISCAATRGSAA